MHFFLKNKTVYALMRLSVLQILLIGLLTAVAYARESDAQDLLKRNISLKAENVSLQKALSEIESRANVRFAYSRSMIPVDEKVSISALNEPLSTVLDRLLSPLQIEYKSTNEQIILKRNRRKTSFLSTPEILRDITPLPIQPKADITVSGKVTDEKNEALPGVSVVLKGSQRGTTTNAEGRYTLAVPNENATLVFSFVGYLPEEMVVGNRSTVDVLLKTDTKALAEVVVVGYGTQQKEDITGAISTISERQMKDAPVAQVGQLLQGKLSGVRIDQVSGRPGEGMNIKIRGAVSITAGADPLYVVDGMPISGNINTINPAEIESITVLKDAAASSLYGSRAANGVVLIQTKSAIPGKTQIDFDAYYGFEQIPKSRRLTMMNAQEYAQFQKEIAELNGRPVNAAFQNPEQYAGKGTDWYDAITRTAPIQSYNLTVNAGMKNFSTSVTGGYFSQEGVIVGTGYKRLSLRVNSIFTPGPKVRIGFNIAPNYATNTNFATDGGPYGSENIVSAALATTPLASPYNPDGSLTLTASDPATFGNPNWLRVAKEKVYEGKNLQLLANAFVEYKILKGLTAKTTVNVQTSNSNVFQFNPSTIGVMFTPPPRIPFGSDNSSRSYNWVNENSLMYQTDVNGHNIDALVDFTAQRFRGENTLVTASNYADDKIQAVSAAGRVVVTSGVQEWALLSYLARLNYNYKSKYLFTASVRRDGSSRFGPDNRWGNFPSASVGWIVSKEDFWKFKPVSFLKLRASYGTTGNFDIGNYTFRSTISPVYYGFNNGLFQGRATTNLGDNALGWERKKQLNVGADIYFLNDRIQLTYNYYSTKSSDLLFNVAVPQSSGFSNIQTNIGELKLWGHEIGINTYNINTSRFSWNTNFNISFDRNKTVSLSTQSTTALFHGISSYGFYSHRSQVGRPVGMFYGAVQDGVYVDQADFDRSPKYADSQVGTIKFRDLNGDGKITFPEDYTDIGNPWPDFIFGMTNTFTYGNFDGSLTLTGTYGNQILTHYENWTTNLDGVFNVLAEVKDRWKSPENPGAGKYGSVKQGTTYLERDRWHTRYIKDGSFLSFKNITLGYTLPLKAGSVVRRLRVYGSVQNAFVITRYPGPNPEVNTRNSASGSSPGIDENSYPVPRTVSFGVNVGF
ncbi:TonB-dependent receptor [Larkinella sp.]|uniref:TonB-dependent receptor n=1 Tax=Larkinella sp. TaxID=2034517 RepID=UPI003BAC4341